MKWIREHTNFIRHFLSSFPVFCRLAAELQSNKRGAFLLLFATTSSGIKFGIRGSERSTQPGHPSVERHNKYQRKPGRKQANGVARDTMVSQCKLVSGWGLRKQRSAPPYGPKRLGKDFTFLHANFLLTAESSIQAECPLYTNLPDVKLSCGSRKCKATATQGERVKGWGHILGQTGRRLPVYVQAFADTYCASLRRDGQAELTFHCN